MKKNSCRKKGLVYCIFGVICTKSNVKVGTFKRASDRKSYFVFNFVNYISALTSLHAPSCFGFIFCVTFLTLTKWYLHPKLTQMTIYENT